MAIVKANFYAQTLNQFAPHRLRGEYLDWGLNAQVMEVQIDDSVATEVYPGDALKIVATSTGKLKVAPVAAGDVAYGYAIYNAKKSTFKAGDIISVLRDGGVMAQVTEEEIAAGTTVYFNPTDGSITATADDNVLAGIALAAVAAVEGGTLIPVEIIRTPIAA